MMLDLSSSTVAYHKESLNTDNGHCTSTRLLQLGRSNMEGSSTQTFAVEMSMDSTISMSLACTASGFS